MWIALLLAALAAAAGVGHDINVDRNTSDRRNYQSNKIADKYGIDQSSAEYIYDEFQGTPFKVFDPNTWGKRQTTDYDSLDRYYQDYLKWKDEVGDMPMAPDVDTIMAQAEQTIDAENAQLNDLYDQTFNRSNEALQQELLDNSAAFSDYRNQLLTNEAMQQQAIAGSTRYELDRQQRNAISRGASAAQRLVSNINAQLGLQAQSAQQSLNTSNALAQQLLAHRQAQAGLRNSYIDAMNNRDMQRANLIQGSAERRTNYQNQLYNQAYNNYEAKKDAWEDRINAYGGDNPFIDVHRRQALQNSL